MADRGLVSGYAATVVERRCGVSQQRRADANLTFTVPRGESWRIAAGATYALNEVTDINVSWAMVWLGDMPVDETKFTSGIRTPGQFDNAWIQAVTGNMTWRF